MKKSHKHEADGQAYLLNAAANYQCHIPPPAFAELSLLPLCSGFFYQRPSSWSKCYFGLRQKESFFWQHKGIWLWRLWSQRRIRREFVIISHTQINPCAQLAVGTDCSWLRLKMNVLLRLIINSQSPTKRLVCLSNWGKRRLNLSSYHECPSTFQAIQVSLTRQALVSLAGLPHKYR